MKLSKKSMQAIKAKAKTKGITEDEAADRLIATAANRAAAVARYVPKGKKKAKKAKRTTKADAGKRTSKPKAKRAKVPAKKAAKAAPAKPKRVRKAAPRKPKAPKVEATPENETIQ